MLRAVSSWSNPNCDKRNQIIKPFLQHELIDRTGLAQLVFLNLALQTQDGLASLIPQHRMILFVKQILKWCEGGVASFPTQAECCRALANVLPSVRDVYGSHWSETVTYLTDMWLDAENYSAGNIGGGGYEPFEIIRQAPLTAKSVKYPYFTQACGYSLSYSR